MRKKMISFFVNLFVASEGDYRRTGKGVKVVQDNDYPWNGNLKFTLTPKEPLEIFIPGKNTRMGPREVALPSDLYSFETTTSKTVSIKINGVAAEYNMDKGYAVLDRTWKAGDVVEVNLPMDVRRVIATGKL